jgi:outer membrane protein assembly factor BamB
MKYFAGLICVCYDGNIYSVDAKTGEQRWKFASEGEHRFTARHIHGADPAAESMPDPFDLYLSSPTVVQDTVYVGSGDGNIYAIDAASGALRRKFRTGNVVHASPAVANDTVYIGSWDTFFYALNAKSGQERWRFKTGEDHVTSNQVGIQSSAVIADGVVYFGCRDSNLYALDAATGPEKWAFSTKGSWVISTPIVADGTLYFATSDSHAGTLIAIDLDKHVTAWTFSTDGANRNAAALTQKNGDPDYS